MDDKKSALGALDLHQIPAITWELLREGVESAKSPLHTPCLATIGEHGPSSRTVVLRHSDNEQRVIACHGDIRSAKISEAEVEPRASWLFYDRDRKLQLRLAGRLMIHSQDEIADKGWDQTTALGRACYNTSLGPGQPIPGPAGAPDRISDENEGRKARSHFAVIACQVGFIDWLLLSVHGHRRAQFHWRKGQWDAGWVSP